MTTLPLWMPGRTATTFWSVRTPRPVWPEKVSVVTVKPSCLKALDIDVARSSSAADPGGRLGYSLASRDIVLNAFWPLKASGASVDGSGDG